MKRRGINFPEKSKIEEFGKNSELKIYCESTIALVQKRTNAIVDSLQLTIYFQFTIFSKFFYY